MKKGILFFVSALALAILAPGCLREDEMQAPETGAPAVSEGEITVEGCLDLPSYGDSRRTKAFGEPGDDACKVYYLYLVVFDENDILLKIYKASPGTQSHPLMPGSAFTPEEGSADFRTYFHVTMDSSAEERYILYIATHEEIASFNNTNEELNDEAGFVATLVTTNSDIAYWGRRKFNTITSSSDMTGIKMIRNFAKVGVKVADDIENFTFQGFRVFNTPVYGTVAPFNDSTSRYETVTIGTGDDAVSLTRVNFDRYANYQLAATKENPYTWLTVDEKYSGFMPPTIAYDDLGEYYDSEGTDNVPWLGEDDSDYLYECSYRPDRNPFIIIKALYGGATCYYKADLVYHDSGLDANQYYNILRNFKYTLNITGVGGPGSSSVYEAFNSVALNNFEASTLSQELSNIAISESRLFVSGTNFLITGGTTFTMYVKSRTGEDYSIVDERDITVQVREATNGSRIIGSESDVTVGGYETYNGDTWRKVTIRVQDATELRPGEVWKQPIVFKNYDGLSRTVNFTLRRPSSLTVEPPPVVEGKDTEVEVTFTIPNSFTSYHFPLYFYVEQERNTLYPKALAPGDAASLSVECGPSMIPGRSGNTYYYRRTLTWDEYSAVPDDMNGLRTFSCHFKTLHEDSATTVWVIPEASGGYFDPFDHVENEYTNKDSFLNGKLESKTTFPHYGELLEVGGGVTVAASTTSDGTLVYSSSAPGTATVDAAGRVTGVAEGTATITASVAETGSYLASSASYTVTVTSGSLTGLDVKWNYEPTYVVKSGYPVRAPIAIATVTDGSDVTVEYSTSPSGLVSIDETDAENSGYVTVSGISAGTVRVTATASSSSLPGYTRSISYDLLVVEDKAPSGTLYHYESFLNDDFGDYTNPVNVVTDGKTYTVGNDVSSAFHEWTRRSSSINVKRDVFYPYYNPASGVGYGAAAKGWGSTEEWTTEANGSVNRHNKAYATHARIVSKAIDLSTADGATLRFYHAGNDFADPLDAYNGTKPIVHVMESVHLYFSRDDGSSWTEQTIKFFPSGADWTYIRNAIEIPAEYCVSTFRLAFDYTSVGTSSEQAADAGGNPLYYAVDGDGNPLPGVTTAVTSYPVMVDDAGYAGTWEIKDVTITGN